MTIPYKLLVLFLVSFSSFAYGENGWETNANVKLNFKTLGFVDSDAYFIAQRRDIWDDDDKHEYEHWESVFGSYAFDKHIEYGVGYRYIESFGKNENRPHLFLTPRFNFANHGIFEIRNKMEYRFREDNSDGFQYRIRPKVFYTIGWLHDDFLVTPYLESETVYSMINGKWIENITKTGVEVKIHDKFILTTFYEYWYNLKRGEKTLSALGVEGVFVF